MSVKLMAQVWERQLDHAEQSVLLAMADHAHDDGSHVFPSINRIAWKTDYSPRQVKRIGKKLRDSGILVLVAAATRGNPTEYRINLNAAPKKQTFEEFLLSTGDKMAPQNGMTNPAQSEDVGVTNPVLTGDTAMAREPLDNHHKEKDQPSITTRSRSSSVKKKSIKPKDERRKHPAIQQLFQIITRWPKKIFWDDIILMADPERKGISKFDIKKLKDMVRIADSVGCAPDNILVWLLPDDGWYVAGVPYKWRNRSIEGALADGYRQQMATNVGSSIENIPGLRKGKNEQ
jgi:hypothetical protein